MLSDYISSSNSLISYIKNSHNPWCIKDLNSKCIYANKADLIALNLPENYNYEGKRDDEIPSQPCQDLWEDFIKDDQIVLTENRKICGVEIAYYGKGNTSIPTPRYFEKYPLYDDDKKIIGLIFNANKIDTASLLKYMDRLNRKKIEIDAPNDTFTKRELEVIFWAQQRLTAKEIAKRLQVTPKTVECYLNDIYKKSNVHSLIQLIEYCRHTGLDSYIPADFIKNGVQLIE